MPPHPSNSTRSAKHVHSTILWLLLGLFCFRVTAQLVVAAQPLPFLPPFEAWHSATLPYSLLVALQVVTIFVCTWIARSTRSDQSVARRGFGRFLLIAGGLYFALMAVRLVLGATLGYETSWWIAPIPTCFHLVLASFLIVAGHYHTTRA